jgi:CRISPR/Cas system-associated exonuclease Cas4 (RecB family)
VAKRHEDTLCPAIPRVWEDGLSEVRADLREWLRRTAMDSVWSPTHFELSFGLVEHDEGRDAASVKEPVALACGLRVRGSIDLVETRRSDGALRATDHKTGKVRASDGDVVKGGTILQPALYALAVESLLPGRPVVGGRLYYCTSTGDYTAVDVPLDTVTRDAVTTVVSAVDDALGRGLLPAAPAKDACKYCDYRPVCGPYEEIRVRTKRDARALPLLAKVRGLA